MKRSAVIAAVVLALLAAFVFIAAPVVCNQALLIDNVHWEGYPLPPCFLDATNCGGHVLGTDENGRDLAARLIAGGSVTLGTALLALLIELALAIGLSVLDRHGGRALEYVITAFAQGMNALPRVPFALLLASITYSMMPHLVWPNTFEIAAWFGVIFWPQAFRAFRAFRVRALPSGVVRQGIADLMTIVLVSSTIEFLGFGHVPPTPTWGNMLANMQTNIEIAWWASSFPAACIFVTVLLLGIVRRGLPPARAESGEREASSVAPSPA